MTFKLIACFVFGAAVGVLVMLRAPNPDCLTRPTWHQTTDRCVGDWQSGGLYCNEVDANPKITVRMQTRAY